MTDYIVEQKQYAPTDPRLGRHVRHDSRSLRFLAPAQDISTLVSIRHKSFIPVLDQGNIGSCTGNAATKCISHNPLWQNFDKMGLSLTDAKADETFAVSVYSAATALDPWPGTYPPEDTGSDGLSVAKVLQGRGMISGYTHATTLEALLTALSKQPVIVGTEWRTDMFEPGSDGRLKITGNVEGGHEYCLDELDVENGRVWLQNSWGEGWGLNGRAWLSWADMKTLLAADGDCTVFTPLNVPAPTPTPTPTPPPTPQTPEDIFADAAHEWLSHRHSSKVNTTFVKATKAYLEALGR